MAITINGSAYSPPDDPRDPQNPGYVNPFYIESRPELDLIDWVVDYNQVFSVPREEFPEILRNKALQLDDRARAIQNQTCSIRGSFYE